MTTEPISDERLAEIRALISPAKADFWYVSLPIPDVAALLSRLDKAEAARDGNFDDAKAYAEAARQQRLWKEKAESKVADLSAALAVFQSYGCPICNGDCAGANPPVMCCPMVILPPPPSES